MFIDPMTLILHSSESLRRAAEITDDVQELKLFLLRMADDFDGLRALMPSPGCVLYDDLARSLNAAPLHALGVGARERSG